MKATGKENLSKLRNFMEKRNIDAILFANSDPLFDINIRYFSGFVQEPGTYSCRLLITQEERTLFVPPIEFGRAKEQADVESVVDIKKFDYSYSKAVSKKLKGCKKIGIVKSKFPLKFYEELKRRAKIKFVDVENFLFSLRAVKLKKEIWLIKKSTKIANSGIKIVEDVLSEVAKGKKISERELASKLEEELTKKGSGTYGAEDPLAFKTIVATGKRSSFPHPYPFASNQIIKKGVGLIDFGAVYQGYCSDMTIPFVIGRISEKQARIVKLTEQAYELAVTSVEIDMPTWQLNEKVNNFLKTKGLELKHGLGHGLGLTVHDAPFISAKPKDKLQLKNWEETKFRENMVFTIEPGLYLKNFGCRLENDILLTRKGPKILTRARVLEI